MAASTHSSSLRTGRRPTTASARRHGRVLSLRLLEGARRRLELARECIERGEDPQRRLRSAMLRITRLPATLAPADEASIANLADLSAYMCRELSAAGGTADLGALGRIGELLREIRCAWVTVPPAASTLCDASPRAARM
jgi:flagellin-specific chaperone FliS